MGADMEFTQLLIRIQEIFLAACLMVQSLESVIRGDGMSYIPGFTRFPAWARPGLRALSSPSGFRILHGMRVIGALGLVWFPAQLPVLAGLLALQFILPFRHRGAFNGGSDFMTAQVLGATFALRAIGSHPGQVRVILCYLGLQTILSYWISGWHKFRHASWRSGEALQVFLRNNRYGTPGPILDLVRFPGFVKVSVWGLLAFELLFPFSLAGPRVALMFMGVGLVFHYAVFRVFGLNRFFWAWLAAYPSVYFVSVQGWMVAP
jgi:hypothetical protein